MGLTKKVSPITVSNTINAFVYQNHLESVSKGIFHK